MLCSLCVFNAGHEGPVHSRQPHAVTLTKKPPPSKPSGEPPTTPPPMHASQLEAPRRSRGTACARPRRTRRRHTRAHARTRALAAPGAPAQHRAAAAARSGGCRACRCRRRRGHGWTAAGWAPGQRRAAYAWTVGRSRLCRYFLAKYFGGVERGGLGLLAGRSFNLKERAKCAPTRSPGLRAFKPGKAVGACFGGE